MRRFTTPFWKSFQATLHFKLAMAGDLKLHSILFGLRLGINKIQWIESICMAYYILIRPQHSIDHWFILGRVLGGHGIIPHLLPVLSNVIHIQIICRSTLLSGQEFCSDCEVERMWSVSDLLSTRILWTGLNMSWLLQYLVHAEDGNWDVNRWCNKTRFYVHGM